VSTPPDTTVESRVTPGLAPPADRGDRAVDAFRQRYSDLRLAPVVVIIPAFNEEDAICAVLREIPREACGLAVDTIVVDDGSSDRTAQVALDAGVYVAALEENSGQGAALRLGYRLAREHGGQYIVTLDADGQWDPGDVSRLLEPILADEADFVLGSRVLGRAETDDAVRSAGVRFFAFLVRLLTGVCVTDTSSGVRVFRAEVTATVRQEEPQYQASELLVGVICQGYRIAERPVVMHKRTAGKSKKGHNVLYGARYGRTLVRTWWRDRGNSGTLPLPTVEPHTVAVPARTDTLVRHWPAALVLTGGLALRLVVVFAYDPFFWFSSTSGYLARVDAVRPGTAHPWGYSGFLWLVDWIGERNVVVLQHVIVLAVAAALYVFLVRRAVATWLAALAIVPLSLSPLLANVEHHLLPEPLFLALVTGALILAVRGRHRPSLAACAAVGLLAAAAGLTELVGLVMIVPLTLYFIWRRAGAARLAMLLVAFGLPLGGYLLWMHQAHDVYAFSTWRGKHLYARVAPFMDCSRLGALTGRQRLLCDPRPVAERPGPEVYLWGDPDAPARTLPDAFVLGFARKVIAHQPLDYVKAVAGGTAHAFYPGQRQRRREPCVGHWGFPARTPVACNGRVAEGSGWRAHPVAVNRTLAEGLRAYARLDYLIGPAFLACVFLTFVALLAPRGGRGWRNRVDGLLFCVVGLALMIAAVATANFSYRYTLPLYATLAPAAALALSYLLRRARRPSRVA